MPRFSSAYSIFVERVAEVRKLEKIAGTYSRREPLGAHDEEVAALCRGAIVLLCAHIEGFSEDLSTIILNNIYKKRVEKNIFDNSLRYYLSYDLINQIKNTDDPSGISEKITTLFERDADVWSKETHFSSQLDAKKFISGFSTPFPENIYRLFRRFGFSEIRGKMAAILQKDFVFCENTVWTIVDIRNKIAHGDHLLAKSPSDIREMTDKAQVFCRSLDKSVCDSCKEYGFAIR